MVSRAIAAHSSNVTAAPRFEQFVEALFAQVGYERRYALFEARLISGPAMGLEQVESRLRSSHQERGALGLANTEEW